MKSKFYLSIIFVFFLTKNAISQSSFNPSGIFYDVNCTCVFFYDSANFNGNNRYSILSKNIVFGDGNNLSINDTLTYCYSNFGNYNALRIINYYDSQTQSNLFDTLKFTINADCECQIKANMSYFNVISCSQISYESYYPSNVSIVHHFGDNQTSSNQSGNHTYNQAGTYQCFTSISYFDNNYNKNCYDTSWKQTLIIGGDSCLDRINFIQDEYDCKKFFFYNSGFSDSVNWDFGDNNFEFNKKYVEHTFSNTGNFTVTMVVAKYINNSITYDTLTQNINVNCDSCKIKAFLNLDIDTLQPYDAIIFNNSKGNINRHYWSFGDGNFSTNSAPIHTYTSSGTFTLKYYAFDTTKTNCMDSFTLTFTIDSSGNLKRNQINFRIKIIDQTQKSSIENEIVKKNLNIYPNPVSDLINILSTNNVQIYVLNNVGQVIFKTKLIANENTEINTSEWSSGVYFIKTEESKIYKILKY